MKINITKKNLNPGEATLTAIEKKLGKLEKYFSKDILADVVLTNMKNNSVKLEATINADGLIFRAEETGDDLRGCLDSVVDKLASQMSRFKKKLIKSNRNKKEVFIDELPESPEPAAEELAVAKTKTFRISPMAVEEAILQMELLEHSFFVFRHAERNNVCVVYKRNDGSYGLLDIEN